MPQNHSQNLHRGASDPSGQQFVTAKLVLVPFTTANVITCSSAFGPRPLLQLNTETSPLSHLPGQCGMYRGACCFQHYITARKGSMLCVPVGELVQSIFCLLKYKSEKNRYIIMLVREYLLFSAGVQQDFRLQGLQ